MIITVHFMSPRCLFWPFGHQESNEASSFKAITILIQTHPKNSLCSANLLAIWVKRQNRRLLQMMSDEMGRASASDSSITVLYSTYPKQFTLFSCLTENLHRLWQKMRINAKGKCRSWQVSQYILRKVRYDYNRCTTSQIVWLPATLKLIMISSVIL